MRFHGDLVCLLHVAIGVHCCPLSSAMGVGHAYAAWHGIPCHSVTCHVTTYQATPCHGMPCRPSPTVCHSMPCIAIRCRQLPSIPVAHLRSSTPMGVNCCPLTTIDADFVLGAGCLLLGMRYLVLGVFGARYLVLGTLYVELGTWYPVHGTWYRVLRTWNCVLGTWYVVLRAASWTIVLRMLYLVVGN